MSARRAVTAAALFLSATGLAAQGTPAKKPAAKPAATATAKPAAKATDSTAKTMDSTKKHVAAKKHKPTN